MLYSVPLTGWHHPRHPVTSLSHVPVLSTVQYLSLQHRGWSTVGVSCASERRRRRHHHHITLHRIAHESRSPLIFFLSFSFSFASPSTPPRESSPLALPMSLFGTSPSHEHPTTMATKSRALLFDDDNDDDDGNDNGSPNRSTSETLFNDDDDDRSPWDMPTPRKQQSRAELVRGLLAGVQVPGSYIDAFDSTLAQDGRRGRTVAPAGIAKTLAAAGLGADHQVRIMNILAPSGGEMSLGRDEFNVLLALIALAQEGEPVSLDSVDERRRSKLLIPYLICRLFMICSS